MSRFPLPRHAVIDDALPNDLADGLLAFALANEANFEPAQVYSTRFENVRDLSFRVSEKCRIGLGEHERALREALLGRFEALCGSTGVRPFPVEHMELELVAHRDKGFYRTHIDTATGDPALARGSRRALSAVCYLGRQPPTFTGGEIRIRGFDGSEGMLVEPRHNRLIAFPSIAPHEVLPTQVPSDAFGDARFSVNCWFHEREAGA